MTDAVNHPEHYNSHPSGVECITVTEHMNFNLGNAIKYIWRAGLKSEDPITDLEKAVWYAQREIARLKAGAQQAIKIDRPISAEELARFKQLWEETHRQPLAAGNYKPRTAAMPAGSIPPKPRR